ncbi:MAG: hypothetical protein ACMXX9_01850 [Candidatus Woesearchaeota archaeon]
MKTELKTLMKKEDIFEKKLEEANQRYQNIIKESRLEAKQLYDQIIQKELQKTKDEILKINNEADKQILKIILAQNKKLDSLKVKKNKIPKITKIVFEDFYKELTVK